MNVSKRKCNQQKSKCIFVLFVLIIFFLSSCNSVYDSEIYQELESKYEDLSEEYDYLKDEKEELESIYDVILDESINYEEKIKNIEESFRKYFFPQFKDGKIREPGEIWNIGNDFSMYMEKPTKTEVDEKYSEIYCRYKIDDGAIYIEDSKVVQAYYSFIYENNTYVETHYDFYQMIGPGKPNESGYYQGEIYFGTEAKDIYVETIIIIDFKVYATTFHIEFP